MAISDLDTLYCRFIDSVVNHRRLGHLDQFLAAEVVEHAPAMTVGIEAARLRLAHWLAAIPDLHLVIEDLVTDGDRLMARLSGTGTQHDKQNGQAPTSMAVRLAVFEAWSVRDGKCLERWLHVDTCRLPGQSGSTHLDRPQACSDWVSGTP